MVGEIEAAVRAHLVRANTERDPSLIGELLLAWMHGTEHWTTSVIAYMICCATLKGTFQ